MCRATTIVSQAILCSICLYLPSRPIMHCTRREPFHAQRCVLWAEICISPGHRRPRHAFVSAFRPLFIGFAYFFFFAHLVRGTRIINDRRLHCAEYNLCARTFVVFSLLMREMTADMTPMTNIERKFCFYFQFRMSFCFV